MEGAKTRAGWVGVQGSGSGGGGGEGGKGQLTLKASKSLGLRSRCSARRAMPLANCSHSSSSRSSACRGSCQLHSEEYTQASCLGFPMEVCARGERGGERAAGGYFVESHRCGD